MSTSQSNVVSAPLDPPKNSNLEFDIASLAAKYELTQQEIDVLSQQQVITQAMTASEPPTQKYIDYAVMSREADMAALMTAGGSLGDPFLPSPPNTSFFAPPSFTIYQEFGTHEFKCVNPLVIVDGKEVAVDTSSFDGSNGTWVCKVWGVRPGEGGSQCKAELVKESASEGGSGESEEGLLGVIKIVELSTSELKQFHTGAIIFRSTPVEFDYVSINGNEEIPGASDTDTRHAAAIMNWHQTPGDRNKDFNLSKLLSEGENTEERYQVLVRDTSYGQTPTLLYVDIGDGVQTSGAVDDVSIYEYERPISEGSAEKIKCHAIHNWYDTSDYDTTKTLTSMLTADPGESPSPSLFHVLVRDTTSGGHPTLKYLPLGSRVEIDVVTDVRYDCESHQLQKKVVTLCLPAVVKVANASGSPEWTCIEGGQAVSHATVTSECPSAV